MNVAINSSIYRQASDYAQSQGLNTMAYHKQVQLVVSPMSFSMA